MSVHIDRRVLVVAAHLNGKHDFEFFQGLPNGLLAVTTDVNQLPTETERKLDPGFLCECFKLRACHDLMD